MVRKLLLFALISILVLTFIGCDSTSTVSSDLGNTELSESNKATEYKFNANISEEEKQLFKIGASMIESFYNVACDSSKFLKTDINDMGDYAVVNIPTDFIYISVKINYESMEVFNINSELYSFTKFLFEQISDFSIEDSSKYVNYKYEKNPVNLEYARSVVKDFVKNTPLSQTKMTFKDSSVEKKYNSDETEYYILKYSYINEKMIYDTVYFKVDAYMRKVVQITN
ncbi:MAG: hypothetical protein JXQ23_00895 [Clostridia bacterium]|nr:hypothetical protein [Clostridia bacterium]